jgi:hypothetical protein
MNSGQSACEEGNRFKFKLNQIRIQQNDTLTQLKLLYLAYVPLYGINIQQALLLETIHAQALKQFLELCFQGSLVS